MRKLDFYWKTNKEWYYRKENGTCVLKDRLASSFSLYALLEMGFSEDEVNPWKNKNRRSN